MHGCVEVRQSRRRASELLGCSNATATLQDTLCDFTEVTARKGEQPAARAQHPTGQSLWALGSSQLPDPDCRSAHHVANDDYFCVVSAAAASRAAAAPVSLAFAPAAGAGEPFPLVLVPSPPPAAAEEGGGAPPPAVRAVSRLWKKSARTWFPPAAAPAVPAGAAAPVEEAEAEAGRADVGRSAKVALEASEGEMRSVPRGGERADAPVDEFCTTRVRGQHVCRRSRQSSVDNDTERTCRDMLARNRSSLPTSLAALPSPRSLARSSVLATVGKSKLAPAIGPTTLGPRPDADEGAPGCRNARRGSEAASAWSVS